jgi:hypothetical protein
MSHLGCDSSLFDALSSHPNIDGFRTGAIYEHHDDIVSLTSSCHKMDNANSIYMDELIHNYSFSCKSIIPHVKFVYYLSEPGQSLKRIMELGYSRRDAVRYYRYRLWGLYEYMARSRGFLVTFSDKDLSGLAEYVGMRGEVDWVGSSGVVEGECAQDYLTYFNAMRSLSWNHCGERRGSLRP